MAAIYTYTSEWVTCPYPGCHKPAGYFVVDPDVVETRTCQQCGRRYTVEVATYKTTTEEV
jgi:hypothetical protein